MPSQFFGLHIAASGLSAFQASLNTTANNISNVQTPGYTRQTTNLESTDPLRVYARYGSTGTGVNAVSITQERNLYYDTKYWQNCSSVGYFSQKLNYLDQVQEVIKDDHTQDGFTTIFAKMFNSMDTLKTNGADESVRNQFINEAQKLCTYFNALSSSLKELQESCDEEIKTSVSVINSTAEKVAALNKQINMIEMRGGHANELRDERAVLIDELSTMVNVETQEFQVHNTHGQDLGGTNYRVIINGQVLVDGNDYRSLECFSSVYKNNQSDAEGMYSIRWADTGMDFAATTGTAGGSLKALFDVRDGNNKENLKGSIKGSKDTVVGDPPNQKTVTTITIEKPSITELNALNIPEKGQITIAGRHYTYDSWEASIGADGVETYSFTLTEDILNGGDGKNLEGKSLECGVSVDAMGVPYYQAQITEFIRNFVQAFNNIEQYGVEGKPVLKLDENGDPIPVKDKDGNLVQVKDKDGNLVFEADGTTPKYMYEIDTSKYGVDMYGEYMGAFFVGESPVGDDYNLEDYEKKVMDAASANGAGYPYIVSSGMGSYYKITGSTVKVNDTSIKDPNYFSTATEIVNGQDKYDIAEKLLTLQKEVKMFRGDSAESFLETLLSDITVDVNKTEIYTNNYTNICQVIANQRTSVSGVDEDEEAMSLIKFQNAYNLASKMISVMSEIYNKLINETGVT